VAAGAPAQIARAAQKTLARTHNQREGFGHEGIVTQTGAVQLAQDELFDGFWTQARQHYRIGDARTDFFVDPTRGCSFRSRCDGNFNLSRRS